MSKAVCEPVRKRSNRKDTCKTCYFWDKEKWYMSGRIEKVYLCCRMPNSIKKDPTEWCGEWKAKVKTIEEAKQITDERRNHNALYRRQNSEKVPEVLRKRIY